MDVDALAGRLLDRAAVVGQAVVRLEPGGDVGRLRSAVRAGAHARGLAVRTGMIEDVLAVVRTDAPLWEASTATMRAALRAPTALHVVG